MPEQAGCAVEKSECDLLWINNARILAVLAVIILHIAAFFAADTSRMGSFFWWVGNACDSCVRWSVPVFIMLSGALLLDAEKDESAFSFYKKRASRILLPGLFWTIFFIGWEFLKGAIKADPRSFVFIFRQLLGGRPYYHMWFLYMLIGLYLITPSLRVFIRKMPMKGQIIFTAVLFVFSMANSVSGDFYSGRGNLLINWFLPYLPYYISGHLLKETRGNSGKNILILFFLLSTVLTALGVFLAGNFSGPGSGFYFYDYLSVTVVPMSLCAFSLLKTAGKPFLINREATRGISRLVLGIYLVHPVFIDIFRYTGVFNPGFSPLAVIPLVSFLVFVFSLAAVRIISSVPYLNKVV